jgi:hypothetical protein
VINLTFLFSATTVDFFFVADEVPLASSWRGLIFLFVLVNAFMSSIYELFIFPFFVRKYKLWHRSRYGRMGTVFGRKKIVSGPNVKEYCLLRGEFEDAWKN